MAQPISRLIENKLSKEEVQYRPSEECGKCGHFLHAGGCEIVEGNISPSAICSKYTMIERLPEVKHAEFYRSEYDKVK
jgi:hypothetical protein